MQHPLRVGIVDFLNSRPLAWGFLRGSFGDEVVDLAAAWRGLTELPFVFAVWAARRGLDVEDLEPLFDRSLREGRLAVDAIVEQASSELDLEPSRVRSYLTESLRFDLGAEEAAGLEEFYRRARDHGLVDSDAALPLSRLKAI